MAAVPELRRLLLVQLQLRQLSATVLRRLAALLLQHDALRRALVGLIVLSTALDGLGVLKGCEIREEFARTKDGNTKL